MNSKFKETNKVDERSPTRGASNTFKNMSLTTATKDDNGDEYTDMTRISDISQVQLKGCKVELNDVSHCLLGQECCTSKNCKTCSCLHEGNTFRSSYTNKVYPVINSTSNFLTCGTENIIYLITCKICKLQYVGETGDTLRKRMCGHRSGIKNETPTFIYRHFSDEVHGLSSCKIQIIEKVTDSGDKELDKQIRLQRELAWILELWTIYPYGMNDKLKGFGNISQTKDIIIKGLLCNATKRTKRSHGKRKNNKSSIHTFNIRETERKLNSGEISLHQIRSQMCQLPLAKLYEIQEQATSLSFNNLISDETYNLIIDMARLRL